MAKRLYVGNLPYETEEEELREHFSSQGKVLSVRIITDRDTSRSKGFGFIEFDTPGEGAKAIEELNQVEFGGRKLVVNEAKPRPSRQG